MITEKELIFKLQGLKQIKPRQEWVSLSKMNILGSDLPVSREVSMSAKQWNFSNIFAFIFQKKLAYAFAVLLFVFAGVVGVLKYETVSTVKVAGSLQSDAVAENTLKSNVEDFKLKSQALAEVFQNKTIDPSVAIKAVKDAAKNLTDTIQKNPQAAKSLAVDINNSKTLLDIPGGNQSADLKQAFDAPYEALDKQLVADYQKMTLTSDQEMVVDNAIKLIANGDYSGALVNLLLLEKSNADKSSTNSTNSAAVNANNIIK